MQFLCSFYNMCIHSSLGDLEIISVCVYNQLIGMVMNHVGLGLYIFILYIIFNYVIFFYGYVVICFFRQILSCFPGIDSLFSLSLSFFLSVLPLRSGCDHTHPRDVTIRLMASNDICHHYLL